MPGRPGPPERAGGGQDDQMDSHDGQRDPDSALILEGIRALHIRMDELEGRVMPVGPAYIVGAAYTAEPSDTADPTSHPDPAAPAATAGPAATADPAATAGPAARPDPAGHSGPPGPAGFAGPVGGHFGGGGRFGLGFVPAWRRPTEGEARWQVSVAVAAAVALQVRLAGR